MLPECVDRPQRGRKYMYNMHNYNTIRCIQSMGVEAHLGFDLSKKAETVFSEEALLEAAEKWREEMEQDKLSPIQVLRQVLSSLQKRGVDI